MTTTADFNLAFIKRQAEQLIIEAGRMGVVLTIVQQPKQPLAMGNYTTVAAVRPVLERNDD